MASSEWHASLRARQTGAANTLGLALALLGLVLLEVAGWHIAAADQCCGDCEGNGNVAVNELVSAVGNALGGCPPAPSATATQDVSSAPTPTSVPDRCAADTPGTRFTAFGVNYVIVEFEVVLEDSPDTYLLRAPTPLDILGHLTNVQNPIYLQRRLGHTSDPCGAGQNCANLGTVCSFPAVVKDLGETTGSFPLGGRTVYSEGAGPAWGYDPSSYGQLCVTIDNAHVPIVLAYGESISGKAANVAPLSSFGYSFAQANYPQPSADEIAELRNGILRIFNHISINKSPLPTPPLFPGG